MIIVSLFQVNPHPFSLEQSDISLEKSDISLEKSDISLEKSEILLEKELDFHSFQSEYILCFLICKPVHSGKRGLRVKLTLQKS